jgi:hypothetical protein
MPTEYRLRTIKDIVDKVPTDRIADCMEELAILLIQASGMSALISESMRSQDPNVDCGWIFPEEITWIDDHEGVIQNNFHFGSDNVLRVTTNRSTETVQG